MRINKGLIKHSQFRKSMERIDVAIWDDVLDYQPYFNRRGEPINLVQYLTLSARKRKDSIVARTTLANGVWIATDLLYQNHQFRPGGIPIIFETMAFHPKVNLPEVYAERYSTIKQARKGHKRMVERYRRYRSFDQRDG